MLHQKTTQNAVAALSRLAQLYESGVAESSAEIARARNLRQPLVAKVLGALARGGLITGSPGPGGGYRLARPPSEITLWDVVALFERSRDVCCPFGPGWCGRREPCPWHHAHLAMRQIEENYLKSTNFAVFSKRSPPRAARRKPRARK